MNKILKLYGKIVSICAVGIILSQSALAQDNHQTFNCVKKTGRANLNIFNEISESEKGIKMQYDHVMGHQMAEIEIQVPNTALERCSLKYMPNQPNKPFLHLCEETKDNEAATLTTNIEQCKEENKLKFTFELKEGRLESFVQKEGGTSYSIHFFPAASTPSRQCDFMSANLIKCGS